MVTREELPDWLTVPEVAEILELSPITVQVIANQGGLQYVGEIPDRGIDTDSLIDYVNRKYGGGKANDNSAGDNEDAGTAVGRSRNNRARRVGSRSNDPRSPLRGNGRGR